MTSPAPKRGMGSALKLLGPLVLVVVIISTRSQSRWLSLYKDGIVDESATSERSGSPSQTYPSSSLQTVHNRTDGGAHNSSLQLLEPTDSFYKRYNISTTPIIIEQYKLLLFTIEKTGSTVSFG